MSEECWIQLKEKMNISSDVKEKVRKIKISRLNKNDQYFLNLIEDMKVYKPFFWSRDFYESKDGKILFQVNIKIKSIFVNQDIVDYYDEQRIIQPYAYVREMIHEYIGFKDYTLTYYNKREN